MIAKDQRNANVQGILTHCNANILALLYQILWLIVRWEETCKVVFLLFNRVKESEGWGESSRREASSFSLSSSSFSFCHNHSISTTCGGKCGICKCWYIYLIFLPSYRYRLFLVRNCHDINKFNMIIIALAEYLLHIVTYIMLHEEPPNICPIVPARKSPLILGFVW